MFIVYCTTNLINGKKYIGSLSKNKPNYLGSGTVLQKAIKKYGKDNFKRETLAEVDDFQLMREIEEYWCVYFNVMNNNLFYNMSNKGHGSIPGRKLSEESIKKIIDKKTGFKFTAESLSKKSQSMTGKIQSDETKLKRSISLLGRKQSPELIAKRSQAMKGIKKTSTLKMGRPKNK